MTVNVNCMFFPLPGCSC